MGERDPGGAGLVGTVLAGAYKLTRLLGDGGMGSVYEGVHLRLGKRVAIKLLAGDLAANPEALARFRQEAEVTSQLGHPHIVQAFDFGAADSGAPYFVMEYLEGEDLDQRLCGSGRLRLASVVPIVRQVASALAAAHGKQVVHRDLKPANVFLVRAEGLGDFVKILDFGIATARAAAGQAGGKGASSGTPLYMAPEQAQGRVQEIDARTDQWALAVIAWEMLAGRGPFWNEDVAALLKQISRDDPPALATTVSGVPAEVERVLRRALSKRREDRFATVTEFAQAFEAAAADAPEPRPTPSRKVEARLLEDVGEKPNTTLSRSAVALTPAPEVGTAGPGPRRGRALILALAGGAALAAGALWLGVLRPGPPAPRASSAVAPAAAPAAPPVAAATDAGPRD
jgi:serine/threonine-protein kinase